MDSLDDRERQLVALGAAIGSNCITCVEHLIPEAKTSGLTDSQIAEAILWADKVRQVPSQKVLHAAMRRLPGSGAAADSARRTTEPAQAMPATGCCCGQHPDSGEK